MGRKPCCSKVGLNRGAWTAMEDHILTCYIKAHGEGKWRNLPKKAGLKRCGKSCRLRWMNYLRPDIKRGNISLDEEDLIIRLHKLLGNRWSLIAGRLPGRTDNEIKNYWNTALAKKANPQQLPLSSSPHPSSQTISPKNKKVHKKKSPKIKSGFEKSRATRPRVVRAQPLTKLCHDNADPKCTTEAPPPGLDNPLATEFQVQDDHLHLEENFSALNDDFLSFCGHQVRITGGQFFSNGDHDLLAEEKIMLENWTATFCTPENEKLDMNSLTFLLD
ncbi:hypothetical protein MLD38_014710 [Melastoma candidum]|uniref:Uncharacterized protein n=1 Tax=Melastoma candidum TaxID=119954 RepID=A0ACB9RHU5_9MYRT|nr:hypothetical protein MLD38_014710 [Melastoma candidum]